MFFQTRETVSSISHFLIGTSKGLFWVGFAFLFLFLVLSRACHHEPPQVTVTKTPSIESTLAPSVVLHLDEAVHHDIEQQAQTTLVSDHVKVVIQQAPDQIKHNPKILVEDQEKKIGEAQILALNELYDQYYGPPIT